MSIVRIDAPDTQIETEIKKQLAELERRYQLEARPLIDELARLQSLKAPRYVMTTEQLPENWQKWMKDTLPKTDA